MTQTAQNEQPQKPPEVPAKEPLEARYAYYRRCQKLRKDGKQCKGAALKGRDVCYAHEAEARAEERRREFRKRLGLPEALRSPRKLQQALQETAQALIDGCIDERTALSVLHELRAEVNRALGRDIDSGWARYLGIVPDEVPKIALGYMQSSSLES